MLLFTIYFRMIFTKLKKKTMRNNIKSIYFSLLFESQSIYKFKDVQKQSLN